MLVGARYTPPAHLRPRTLRSPCARDEKPAPREHGVKIGIDMYLAQQHNRSLAGAYAARLVRELVTRFDQHEWFLYFHPAAGAIDGVWQHGRVGIAHREFMLGNAHAESVHSRRVATGESTVCLANGQAALIGAPDEVDVWLTTTALDWRADYLPPSAPKEGVRLAGLLFDLAPVLAPDRFCHWPQQSERYRQSVLSLARYDLLLTLAEATRLDCTRSLGLAESNVISIGTTSEVVAAVADRERPQAEQQLPNEIRKPFVLCLAGDDEHQTVAEAAAVMELLSTDPSRQCQFVVLSRWSPELRSGWQREIVRRGLQGRLLLVEAGSDEDRRLLCSQCAVVVDGGPHEGSGLPLLAALQCGAAAIVDRRSWHAGLAKQAALLADVKQPVDLAAKLDQLLSQSDAIEGPCSDGSRAVAEQSVTAAAEYAMRALEALDVVQVGRAAALKFACSTLRPSRRSPEPLSRPPLAFFSPLLPLRTGIADYSERLLESLTRHFQIDLYHDEGYLPEISTRSSEFGCRDRRLFERYNRAAGYAGIVYQMANTHYCADVYETLLKHPGVVVLHDFALPEFHVGLATRDGAPADFLLNEIAVESCDLADDYRASNGSWSAEPGGLAQALVRRGLTLNRRILQAATIVVVHDRWGAEQIRHQAPHLADKVRVIPHGSALNLVAPDEKQVIRQRYGFRNDELILSCFGVLNGAKYHREAIAALAAIRRDFPTARLIFVGADLNDNREQRQAEELGIGDRVRFFGHAPMQTFLELMSITDLALNLRRPPTRGETSGALLTLLSAGVPTVVTNVDTFASYSDAVVYKIGPLAEKDGSLEHAVRKLLGEPSRRQELGQAAIDYVAQVHSWPRVAALYADAVHAARRTSMASGCKSALGKNSSPHFTPQSKQVRL
jgi:glycosyltransferase involved in cell wall biosynthesis